MTQSQSKVVQEVDILSIIRDVGKRNKKLQAKLLQEIERNIDKNSLEFEELRKFVLDEINGYTRSIMRDIFGDIEFMIPS